MVGGVEPGRLGLLGSQVRDLQHPPRRGGDRGAQVANAKDRQQAGVERSGRQHHLIGGRDRGDRLGGRGGVARHQLHPPDASGAVLHRDLPLDRFALDVGLQHDGVGRRREHPPDGVEETTRFLERGGEVAERLRQADDDQVPERMPAELSPAEAMLEGVAPHGFAAGQRDQAPSQVAGRRHAEVAS